MVYLTRMLGNAQPLLILLWVRVRGTGRMLGYGGLSGRMLDSSGVQRMPRVLMMGTTRMVGYSWRGYGRTLLRGFYTV